jgi:hypothetical protein
MFIWWVSLDMQTGLTRIDGAKRFLVKENTRGLVEPLGSAILNTL